LDTHTATVTLVLFVGRVLRVIVAALWIGMRGLCCGLVRLTYWEEGRSEVYKYRCRRCL
jgi:hypothetical protein